LPGAVLPAGPYRFELVAAPNIVRVIDHNGRVRFIGLTRPVERPRTVSWDRGLVSPRDTLRASVRVRVGLSAYRRKDARRGRSSAHQRF
jgi:hypothetical protein